MLSPSFPDGYGDPTQSPSQLSSAFFFDYPLVIGNTTLRLFTLCASTNGYTVLQARLRIGTEWALGTDLEIIFGGHCAAATVKRNVDFKKLSTVRRPNDIRFVKPPSRDAMNVSFR